MKMNSNDSESTLSEINIIPLVDIMLVLLIIFMVTAPMMNNGLEVDLPQVSEASSVDMDDKDTILTIKPDGKIFIDDAKESFSIVSIENPLVKAFKDKKDKVLYLKADSDINYGYVVKVMGTARRAGVEKIGMITQTEEPKRKRRRR